MLSLLLSIAVTWFCLCLMSSFTPPEREIKVVRPLYSVEVTETETAKFETEISESDIHATWKLKGETLHPTAVRAETEALILEELNSSTILTLLLGCGD